jgi:hypothetical protein
VIVPQRMFEEEENCLQGFAGETSKKKKTWMT